MPEVILIETCEDMGSSGAAPSQRITWEGNQHEVAEQQPQVTQQQSGSQPIAEGPQQQSDGIPNICDYVLNLNQVRNKIQSHLS